MIFTNNMFFLKQKKILKHKWPLVANGQLKHNEVHLTHVYQQNYGYNKLILNVGAQDNHLLVVFLI